MVSPGSYNQVTYMILAVVKKNDVMRAPLDKGRSSNNIEIEFDNQVLMTISRRSRAVILAKLTAETFCKRLNDGQYSVPIYQCFR